MNLTDPDGLAPGDPFPSAREAAEDWAEYVQSEDAVDNDGNSIKVNNYEYGSVISETTNEDGTKTFSYNEPLKGTRDNVPFGGTKTELDNAVGNVHNHNEGADVPSSKQASAGSRIRRSNGVNGNSDQDASEALSDRSNVSTSRTFTSYVLGKRSGGERPIRGFRFRGNRAREVDD